MRIRVGCARIIHPLHLRANRRVFRLGSCDADRGAVMNERVKFRRRFTFQTNATMRPRHRMDEALMKSVGWCELAPESHRVTNIAAGNIGAGFSRHYSTALN